jgi:hypothetical protein
MERVNVREAELEHAIHGSGQPVLFIHGVLIGDSFKQLLGWWARPAIDSSTSTR